ncbi:MAG TPA: hypothetical protein VD931_00635, partial [Baekduia sp.]|nr:hypothetical protein [Baekduia sp.]
MAGTTSVRPPTTPQQGGGASGRLLERLERALPERPFDVELWDGAVLPGTTRGGPRFTARSPAAVRHVLRAPGQLGIGRAYVSGELALDDLDAVMELVRDFR